MYEFEISSFFAELLFDYSSDVIEEFFA